MFGPASDPTPLSNVTNGAIDATSGTFVLLSGNNPVTIEPGAIAEIDTAATGATSYTGSVTFNNNAGTLVLDQPADFPATITGFGQSDTISLEGISFTSQSTDVWTQVSTGPNAAGTLEILNGGTVEATLNLSGTYTQGNFALSADNDGNSTAVTYTTSSAVSTLTITVETATGFDGQNSDPLAEMGSGAVQSVHTDTTFTVVDTADDVQFTVVGTGFTYGSDGTAVTVTGGTLTSFEESAADNPSVPLYNFTGLSVDAATWITNVQYAAAGNQHPINALTANLAFVFDGHLATSPNTFGSGSQADTLTGGSNNDDLDGGGAPAGQHDTLTGGAGSDAFVFGAGYGAETITDFDQGNSGHFDLTEGDTLVLNGITGQPTFTQDGSNLQVNFGNGDVLTLDNMTQAEANEITVVNNNNGGGNNGPEINSAGNTVSYTGSPVTLDQSLTISKSGGSITSLSAAISSGARSGDTLTINGFTDGTLTNTNDGSTIHYHFDSVVDQLVLSIESGTPTIGDFVGAEQLIQYSSTTSDPTAGGTDTSRTVTWEAEDNNNLFSPAVTTTILVGPDTWTNTAGGDWSNAGNWSNLAIPGSTEAATIGVVGSSAYIVNVSDSETVGSLSTIATAGLDILSTGSLTIAGTSGAGTGDNLFSGVLTNSGTFTFQGESLDITDNIYNINGGAFVVGNAVIDSHATFDGGPVDNSGGSITVNPESTLYVENATITDGTITVATFATLYAAGGSTLDDVAVTNSGTIDLGTVVVNTTSLTLEDGTSVSGGSLTLGSGDTVYIEGSGATLDNVSVQNTGTIQVDINANTTTTLVVDDGTALTGNVSIGSSGVIEVQSGSNGPGATFASVEVTISGAGKITVDSGATLTLGSSSSNVISGGNGVGGIVNNGTIDVDSATKINGGADITGTGQFNVQSSATLTLDDVTFAGTLINHGSSAALHVDSGDTLTIAGAVINGGMITMDSNASIVVESGKVLTLDDVSVSGTVHNTGATLQINGSGGSSSAVFLAGATITGGTINNAGEIQVDNNSTIKDAHVDGLITGSTATLTLDDVTFTGTISNSTIATLNVDGANTLTLSGADISGGFITNSGTIDVTGATTIENGASFDGSVTIASAATLTLNEATVSAAISNNGTIEFVNTGNLIDDGAHLDEKVTVGASATVTFNDATFASGTMTNNSTIKVTGAGLTLAAAAIDGGAMINSGTIDAAGAILDNVSVNNSGGAIQVNAPVALAYTTVDDPGKAQTGLYGINNSGEIVGYGADTAFQEGGLIHSYIVGGVNFDPGFNSAADGVNNSGVIVGGYNGAGYEDIAGIITSPSAFTGSGISGIDDAGDLVGVVNGQPIIDVAGTVWSSTRATLMYRIPLPSAPTARSSFHMRRAVQRALCRASTL